LDGKTIETAPDVLLITDSEGPVGLAGIMGGQRTAVSAETVDVFFEVAYFSPHAIAGPQSPLGPGDRRQPTLRARSRSDFAATRNGPGFEPAALRSPAAPPVRSVLPSQLNINRSAKAVPLRRARLERLLGVGFADDRVAATLLSLQTEVVPTRKAGWSRPPPHRFDITSEADLIEEVARIIGYQAIP